MKKLFLYTILYFLSTPIFGQVDVSGLINRQSGQPISGVTLNLSGSQMSDTITNDSGQYIFPDLPVGMDYTITPSFAGNPDNACISIRDLALLGKHVFNISLIDNPYALIAGDINNNDTLDAADILELQQFILGMDTAFSNNSSWRFIDSAYVFPNPSNPWMDTFPEAVSLTNLQQDTFLSFIGAKIGDISDTIENTLRAPFLTLNAPALTIADSQNVSIAITANGFTNIGGLQFSLTWDSTVLKLDSVSSESLMNFSEPFYFAQSNILSVCWFPTTLVPIDLADSSAILNLHFELLGQPGDSSPIQFIEMPTTSEVIDGSCLAYALNANDGMIGIEEVTTDSCMVSYLWEDQECGAVQFTAQTDTSLMVAAYAWDVNCDSIIESTEANPLLPFDLCGDSSLVCLTVIYMNGDTCFYEELVRTPGDTIPPFIMPLADVDVNSMPDSLGNCTAMVSIPIPMASDSCSQVDLMNDFNGMADASGVYPEGTTLVTYTATDSCGNATSIQFNVTVACADTCQASFTWMDQDCGNIQFMAQTDTSRTVMAYAWDVNCDSIIESTEANPLLPFDLCGDSSLVCLTVIYMNGDTCFYEELVSTPSDTIPPFIMPLSDVDITGMPDSLGNCTAMVSIPVPMASDSCSQVALMNDFNGMADASGVYPEGTTLVTYTATDSCGNATSMQFNVTVACTDTCQASFTWMNQDCGNIQFMAQTDTSLMVASYAWDINCDSIIESMEANPLLPFDLCGDSLPVCLTVIYMNGDTCFYEELVSTPGDTIPPFIMPLSDVDITGMPDSLGNCTAMVSIPVPMASDSCSQVALMNDFNGMADASGVYPEGTTLVTYTATDSCGNATSMQFNVTVACTDTCQASFTWMNQDCGNIQFMAQTDTSLMVASYAWDINCDSIIESMEANPLLPFDLCGDSLPVCLTVIYMNGDTCFYEELVSTPGDTIPPFIMPLADIDVNSIPDSIGNCTAMVTIPIPMASDSCSQVALMNDFNGMADASGVYPEGTTLVTYTATDSCGNATSFQFNVNVTCQPVDTCMVLIQSTPQTCGQAQLSVNLVPQNQGHSIATYAWDTNCDGTVESTEASPILNLDPCGGATPVCLTLVFDDSVSCSFEEMIMTLPDTISPAINCLDTIMVNTNPDSCTFASDLDLFIIDDCDPDPALAFAWTLVNGEQGSGPALPLLDQGSHQITVMATDQCGNQSDSCTFTLIVIDEEPPQIQCPDLVVENVLGCSEGAVVTYPLILASDNCALDSIGFDIPSGSFFPCGDTVVTVTATDIFGNSTSCTFTVSVQGCDNCASIVAGNLDCGMSPGTYAFTLDAENRTTLPNSASIVSVSSSVGEVTLTDSNLSNLSGTLNLSPPIATEVMFFVNFEFPSCAFGPISCTDTITLATPCCENIFLTDQVACSNVEGLNIPLEGDLDFLTGVDYIRWYLANEPCDTFNLIRQSTEISDLTFNPAAFAASFPDSDSLCVYAEVIFRPEASCTILVSDTATIFICDPIEGSLQNPNTAYCSDSISTMLEPITFLTDSLAACDYSIAWYLNNELVMGETDDSYTPGNLAFDGDPEACFVDYSIEAVVMGQCDTLNLETSIRVYNENAPAGTLALNPNVELPICPGEAVTLEYMPQCVDADSMAWTWSVSTDNDTFNIISGAGSQNTQWQSNPLTQDTWYRVTRQNGVCPPDSVTYFVGVKDSLMVSAFSAMMNDSCAPNGVNLAIEFTPAPTPACPIIVNWYKDGMLLTSTVTAENTASFAYTGPIVPGNYYAILEGFCCGELLQSEVITIEPAFELALEAPCFRCNEADITLEGILTNAPAADTCTYQWYLNGEPLLGETSSTLMANEGDANYELVVTCGTCTQRVSTTIIQCGTDLPDNCDCPELVEEVASGFTFREVGTQTFEFIPVAPLSGTCNAITWTWGDGTPNTASDGSEPVIHQFASMDPSEVVMEVTRTQDDGMTCTERFSQLVTETSTFSQATGIQLYPNPTSDRVTIEFEDFQPKAGIIQVLDGRGRLVLSKDLPQQQSRFYITLVDLPASIYTIRILDENALVWTKRIVKE